MWYEKTELCSFKLILKEVRASSSLIHTINYKQYRYKVYKLYNNID